MCGDCYQARQMDDEIAWSQESEDDAETDEENEL
jgi:hypothetical protein